MTGYFKTLGMLLLVLLPGCCPTPHRPLPAAISIDDQARRLTEWSRQLPRIKARTVVAGVRLNYRDDKGQDRTVNAEGLLQIRQHVEQDPNVMPPMAAPADVLLLGTSFDQPAFEAGRNAKDWWFAIKLDTKKAWMGDATKPVDFSTIGGEGSASILRADLVPDLLGLSELPPNRFFPALQPQAGLMIPGPRTGDGPFLMMVVNDAEGTNELFIGQMSEGGRPFLSREILVDRYSGHISEVRMFDRAGLLAVRSQLRDYAPVTYAEGVERPATAEGGGGVPQFPKKVVVSYPGQFLTVSLEFDEVKVVGEFKPAVFVTPDFEKQGLKVIPAE